MFISHQQSVTVLVTRGQMIWCNISRTYQYNQRCWCTGGFLESKPLGYHSIQLCVCPEFRQGAVEPRRRDHKDVVSFSNSWKRLIKSASWCQRDHQTASKLIFFKLMARFFNDFQKLLKTSEFPHKFVKRIGKCEQNFDVIQYELFMSPKINYCKFRC